MKTKKEIELKLGKINSHIRETNEAIHNEQKKSSMNIRNLNFLFRRLETLVWQRKGLAWVITDKGDDTKIGV